jgi:hypothetical protein
VDLLVWLGAPSTHLESEESSWAAVMRGGAIAIAWGLQSPSGIHPVFFWEQDAVRVHFFLIVFSKL